MRSLITRMSCALAALALILTTTTSASADPAPRELVENATTAIARTTAVAGAELNHAAHSAVMTINALANQGAPPAVIREAAQRHRTAINTISATSKAQSDRIASATINLLDHIDAPAPLSRTVAVANTASNVTITAAARRARAAIAHALAATIGEEAESPAVLDPKATDAASALAA